MNGEFPVNVFTTEVNTGMEEKEWKKQLKGTKRSRRKNDGSNPGSLRLM